MGACGGGGVRGKASGGKASGNVPPPSSSPSPPPGLEALDFADLHLHPWGNLPLQVAVAVGVASFWRGAWWGDRYKLNPAAP